MAIRDCLANAVEGGEISRREAADLLARFEEYRARRAADGLADADLLAKQDVALALRAEAAERRRLAALQERALQKALAGIDAYRTPGGAQSREGAAIGVLEDFHGLNGADSVEGVRKAILSRAMEQMREAVKAFERTAVLGRTRNPATLDNLVDEAFGKATGDAAARQLYLIWFSTAEWLRQRRNRAGGATGFLDNWGLPQVHDAGAVLAAGRERWKADIVPLLEPANMRHPLTGQALTPGELDAALEHVYASITTGGWNTREPSMLPQGRGSVARQMADERFLIFRDGEAWRTYQRAYGQGDAFAAMMGHIKVMARDIAAMEVLGPNPAGTIEFITQRLMKDAAGKGAVAEGRALAAGLEMRGMWEVMRGGTDTPVRVGVANTMATLRHLLTAARLGGAMLSAAGDPFINATARAMAGVPVMQTLPSHLRQLFSGAARAEAREAGLILDSALHVFGREATNTHEMAGKEWSRWLADRVLTWQGLTAWTQAGRHAFQMDFMREMARAARAGGPPPAHLKPWLERWGLDGDWGALSRMPIHTTADGMELLRPRDMYGIDERLGERVMAMIQMTSEFAVPSGTVRGKSFMLAGQRPGTLAGELLRTFGQFKGFAATVSFLYGKEIMLRSGQSMAGGAAFAGAALATFAMGGAISGWLKDLRDGKDPRPIMGPNGNPLPWFGQAVLQGGGLGVFGDFLLRDVNRYGSGPWKELAGPLPPVAFDLWKLTVGNALEMAQGKDTKAMEELRRFAGRNVPGATLWPVKTAYERMVLDQLAYISDPKAHVAFRRRERQELKDWGTSYWWRPGEAGPERGPDLNVLRAP